MYFPAFVKNVEFTDSTGLMQIEPKPNSVFNLRFIMLRIPRENQNTIYNSVKQKKPCKSQTTSLNCVSAGENSKNRTAHSQRTEMRFEPLPAETLLTELMFWLSLGLDCLLTPNINMVQIKSAKSPQYPGYNAILLSIQSPGNGTNCQEETVNRCQCWDDLDAELSDKDVEQKL